MSRQAGTIRRTDQIGPSSHQNQFCRGVLVGNWAEERLLDNERIQSKPQSLKLESTFQAAFMNPAVAATMVTNTIIDNFCFIKEIIVWN